VETSHCLFQAERGYQGLAPKRILNCLWVKLIARLDNLLVAWWDDVSMLNEQEMYNYENKVYKWWG